MEKCQLFSNVNSRMEVKSKIYSELNFRHGGDTTLFNKDAQTLKRTLRGHSEQLWECTSIEPSEVAFVVEREVTDEFLCT